MRLLSGAEARALEPDLACTAALLSPATGIVDSHALMLALLADAEAAGATLAIETPVERLAPHPEGGAVLDCAGGFAVHARHLVNAAGLGACGLAAGCWSARAALPCPRAYMAKGNYFALAGKVLV